MSRSGWIATLFSLTVFLVLLIRRRAYRIPALVLLLLLVIGVDQAYSRNIQMQKRIENALNRESAGTGVVRLWLSRLTVAMWKDHVWLGVGPGQFDYRFPAYRSAQIQSRPGYSHNDYLQTLAEWGVVGLTIITAALGFLFLGVFKTSRFVRREGNEMVVKNSNRAAFVFGGSIGLLAILVHSLTDFNMHVPANAILAISLMALLSNHIRFATDGWWVGTGWIGRSLATTVGLLALTYLGTQGWRRAGEFTWIQRGGAEKFFTQTRLDAFKKAATIEPMNFETHYEVGETLRQLGWEGDRDSQALLNEAIDGFQRGVRLDPFDPYNYIGIGMCLDALENHERAAPYFEQAVKRDPNNYYVRELQGWHFVQTGDYLQAKQWFERSLEMQNRWNNPSAWIYLGIAERKLQETSTPAPLTGPPKK